MEEQPAPTTDPISKKRGSKATIILTIALILALLAGGFAYWWRNDQAEQQKKADAATITSLQAQVATLMGVSTDTDTSESTGPSASDKANIIASITSGNTAALEGYMASSVHVVIAASEGVFDHTPAQAVTDLNYVTDAIEPWDFALSDATLADYASGDYKDYFHDNSIVGVSSDLQVVVFNFDDDGNINEIFMAANTDLL